MFMNRNLLTTKEAASLLGVTTKTVYDLVEKGELRPINYKEWTIDGIYYFDEEEIIKLKKKRQKPGLSTGDIAKKLGTNHATVIGLIKKNILPAQQHKYRGRLMYFVNEEDFQKFLETYHKQKSKDKKSFRKCKHGYLLFQSFASPDGLIARLMENNLLYMESGDILTVEEALNKGYTVRYPVQPKPFIYKRGYFYVVLPKSNFILSPVYDVIEVIYQEAGKENIRLWVDGSSIHLQVRPIRIKKHEDLQGLASYLQTHVVEGKIHLSPKGLYLDSNLKPITFYVKESVKEELKQAAEEQGKTLEEYICNQLGIDTSE
jgi:DNA-binding transcriptional MerR regulator